MRVTGATALIDVPRQIASGLLDPALEVMVALTGVALFVRLGDMPEGSEGLAIVQCVCACGGAGAAGGG